MGTPWYESVVGIFHLGLFSLHPVLCAFAFAEVGFPQNISEPLKFEIEF